MGKKYRYDMKDEKYIVIEQQTDQIVSALATKEQVKEIVSLLNAGHGFDGNTPKFFIIPTGVSGGSIFSAQKPTDAQTSV